MSLLEDHVLLLDQANPGAGPVAPAIDNKLSPRSETYLSLDHNIRSKMDNNFIPTINSQNASAQQYVNDKYVNFTGREQINPTVVSQVGLKGDAIWNNNSIFDARVTTNETTQFSYSGNAVDTDKQNNFWRYADKPKVTTNETTQYSYAGNAVDTDREGNFWRYKDKPKVTTNETTQYSYAGDPVGTVTSHNQADRTLFTGEIVEIMEESGIENFNDFMNRNKKKYRRATSGVTNWGTKSLTLVEGYMPGPNGAVNIQQDPDEIIGNMVMKSDWDSINSKGSGTYEQALPNATNYQQIEKEMIGEVKLPPNKLIGVDSRQTAQYQVMNLKNNGLSIYQTPSERGEKNTIPTFFIDSNARDYSGIANKPVKYIPLPKYEPEVGVVSVYPNNEYNYNNVKLFNTYANPNALANFENPLLLNQMVIDKKATYLGKGYPGNAIEGNNSNPSILLDVDSEESRRYLNRINCEN